MPLPYPTRWDGSGRRHRRLKRGKVLLPFNPASTTESSYHGRIAEKHAGGMDVLLFKLFCSRLAQELCE